MGQSISKIGGNTLADIKFREKVKKIDSKVNSFDSQIKEKANKKEMPYVNVKLYGAKGDGVTDDTESIKKALSENSNLYFPKGTYIISESLTLSKSTNIKGVSQVFNWGVPSSECSILKGIHDDYIFKCSWSNQNNFYNINFDGLGIHTPCSSFIVECGFTGNTGIFHSRVATIDRCVFKDCSNAGIHKLVDSKILNSFFYGNKIAIYAYDSNDNIIQGNKIEWNNIGIKFDINNYNLVQNNIFDRQETYGIESVNGSSLSIKNNQFERNLVNHIKLNNSNCSIIGNSMYWKNSEDNETGDLLPKDAIYIDSVDKCLIQGNTIIGNKMFKNLYSSVTGLNISDNMINGVSDNYKWVNMGTVSINPNTTGTLSYDWNKLNFLNANGYDVNVVSYKIIVNNYTYTSFPDLKMGYDKNNCLYADIINTSSTNTNTYELHVLLEHTQWTKR